MHYPDYIDHPIGKLGNLSQQMDPVQNNMRLKKINIYYICRHIIIRPHYGILLTLVLISGGRQLLMAQAKTSPRPNILIFIADDLNMQDVGAYGNTDVHTPNMDRLANEGMMFLKAYAASSMCTPSRSALFTGMYPHHNGAQMNHFTVKPGVNNIAQFMKTLGYRVVISGKTDVFPLDNFPFEVIGKEFGKYEPIENRVDWKNESVHMIENHCLFSWVETTAF